MGTSLRLPAVLDLMRVRAHNHLGDPHGSGLMVIAMSVRGLSRASPRISLPALDPNLIADIVRNQVECPGLSHSAARPTLGSQYQLACIRASQLGPLRAPGASYVWILLPQQAAFALVCSSTGPSPVADLGCGVWRLFHRGPGGNDTRVPGSRIWAEVKRHARRNHDN